MSSGEPMTDHTAGQREPSAPSRGSVANHDAVPAAIASVESVVPQPTTHGDSDRTDKAAPRPSEGTGNTPVANDATTGRDDRPQPVKDGDSDRPYPIGIDPAAYEGDIVSRLRHWRGLHLAHGGELFEAAADEIERLRTVMYRVVDQDCTVAIQGGTFYADDEPLFAISDTRKPRNGAVDTPDSQPTPGEGSTP